ncbi:hypothetical protein ASE80_16960 [Pseudomonas sp. Leaf15]|uniref:hypothetical protein n=1 Tax=unclassified Pseudomonas TaxID=196821 RepID=UPI000702A92F|nr:MULTISPECIES: hypothetical protein [unclassified Pseudomonas]KQM46444.1 hypothetical protein ASE80_16960 [Pseudomonas sp. Leaf15]RAH01626.1 hypothetical protein DJ480_16620 [Pseudomonas sp. Leaf98]
MKKSSIAVFLFMTSGCQPVEPDSASLGAKAKNDDRYTILEVTKKVDEMLQPCFEILGVKSKKAEDRAWNTNMIAIGGLVAGSVVAPALIAANAAANATWIAAFSGAAGASAITVKNLDSSGLSGSHDVLALNALATEVRADMAKAYNITLGENDRLGAAAHAIAVCKTPLLQPMTFPGPT